MKYMLLIYGDERVWAAMTKDEMERLFAEHRAYGEAMTKAGVLLAGEELAPVASATSLRFGAGKPLVVDGPFAETKEQLGGFYMIEVDDLERAIEWAEKVPGMSQGTVEIRPLGGHA